MNLIQLCFNLLMLQASKYEIKGYPTIKYFVPGKKDADSVQEYDGGRTSSDIVNWALEKLAENIPAPEVIQITSEQSLRNACEDKPICVVSVLPHILDCQSDCRNGYLKILNDLGEKYKKKMWGYGKFTFIDFKNNPNINVLFCIF